MKNTHALHTSLIVGAPLGARCGRVNWEYSITFGVKGAV